jgi:hypothetical protein
MVHCVIVVLIKKWNKIWMMFPFMDELKDAVNVDVELIMTFLTHNLLYQSFTVAYANDFEYMSNISLIKFFLTANGAVLIELVLLFGALT